VFLEATDRAVNQIEERFDLVLRARPETDGDAGMVVKTLGRAQRILVASPAYLERNGRPATPAELSRFDVVSQLGDHQEGAAVWTVANSSTGEQARVRLNPRLVSSDLRVQHQAALHGIGIALMPEPIVGEALRQRSLEQVLPDWSAGENLVHLVYPPPRGMLPSVRSLIDHLVEHLPKVIHEAKR
jgi:DNA-binding transcriptional LysR family regulator